MTVIKWTGKKRRKREESSLQVQLMMHLDAALPPDAFAFHVPNGGSRNLIEAVNLKRQGVKAGIPDIVIVYQGGAYGLELKAKAGSISDSQKVTFPKLRAAGMRIEVARSLPEAVGLIGDMGIPLAMPRVLAAEVAEIFRDAKRAA